jgi:insulysin
LATALTAGGSARI